MKTVNYNLKNDGKVQTAELDYDADTNTVLGLEKYEFLNADEIVDDILTNRLPEDDQEAMKNMEDDELILMHHGFGMWIRNSYGLWLPQNPHTAQPKDMTNKEYASADIHPDQYSFAIIQKIHKKLGTRYSAYDEAMKRI